MSPLPSNYGAGEESWKSLDSREIKPFNIKGNQPWILIGRIDVEAEAPVLWPPGVKSQLIGKDWCWEKLKAGGEGTTEDEMVGWHYWFNGYEFKQAPGVCDNRKAWHSAV